MDYTLQWTLKRGDKVNYRPIDRHTKLVHKGEHGETHDMSSKTMNNGKMFAPVDNTYVWTLFGHECMCGYVIQHKDGFDRDFFLQNGDFPDGFEAVHSSQLKPGLKYIWADEDELELVERPVAV